MKSDAGAIRTALRVLEAAIQRMHPQEADLDELRKLAPECAGYAADDLAVEIINRMLQKRAAAGG